MEKDEAKSIRKALRWSQKNGYNNISRALEENTLEMTALGVRISRLKRQNLAIAKALNEQRGKAKKEVAEVIETQLWQFQ